jgi:hypothetical protein
VAAALQIWSATFSAAFDSLPQSVREAVQRKVDEMGTRLDPVTLAIELLVMVRVVSCPCGIPPSASLVGRNHGTHPWIFTDQPHAIKSSRL